MASSDAVLQGGWCHRGHGKVLTGERSLIGGDGRKQAPFYQRPEHPWALVCARHRRHGLQRAKSALCPLPPAVATEPAAEGEL